MDNQLVLFEDYQPVLKEMRARMRILDKIQKLSNDLIKELKREGYLVHSPEDAYKVIGPEMQTLEREQLRVVTMNTRNRLLNMHLIYQGSLNSSQVRIGELFRPAIIELAAGIIVAHNHPSGDPTPSPDDVAVTRAFVEAGRLLDIDVVDHLVIGAGCFVSLKERGLGFK